jgi:D-alanyl-D-alanine carboxypeptidase
MWSRRFAASRGLRWGLSILAAALFLGTVTDPADARARRRAKVSYQPPYAAIVVDVNSGRVLHATNADSLRHPASLAKVMTLYLLFERLEAGKLNLDTRLPVSAEAARQAPTKLGLEPGSTISVEDAIKGLVTRSANDAAVVIAEAIAGDEESFARLMTQKARALGMTRTVYRNASGLPDNGQVTTARDQAVLARAIQDRFPRFYRYFAIASFRYRGQAIRNHNRLLGRLAGVDGIKTGYTRASGFNLMTSVRRGNRHLVAVVLGGSSAAARDARMRTLIEQYIAQASTHRSVAAVTEAKPTDDQGRAEEPLHLASGTLRAPSRAAQPAPGSTEPIRAIPVRTVTVRPRHVQTAGLAPRPTLAAVGASAAAANQAGILGVLPAGSAAQAAARSQPSAPTGGSDSKRSMKAQRPGWVIQIGAFPDEEQARRQLTSAKSLAKHLLASRDPITQPVVKGEQTLYRARFAGFDKESAEAACRYLKRKSLACLALKD